MIKWKKTYSAAYYIKGCYGSSFVNKARIDDFEMSNFVCKINYNSSAVFIIICSAIACINGISFAKSFASSNGL